MRSTATILMAGFALVSIFSHQNARAADAVAVDPPYVTPGKPITLKWYFTGEKVTISGGRFGKGTVVTGKTSITDTPRATTKYTFDVWYKAPAPKPAETKTPDNKPTDPKLADPKATAPKANDVKVPDVKPADPKATDPKTPDAKPAPAPQATDTKNADTKTTDNKGAHPKQADGKATDAKQTEVKQADPPAPAAPQEMVTLHVQYTTTAEVWSGIYPAMKTYRDPRGWQISSLATWKHDGSPNLNYFQIEDDSVERVAVAIMSSQAQTLEDIVKKMNDDVPSHYQNAVINEPINLTFNSVPAKMVCFTGMDMSHPGTKTSSVVLFFVRNDKAYVVSARTDAARFGSRRPILEKMLKSFAFN